MNPLLPLLVSLPFLGGLLFWFSPKTSNSLPRMLALAITTACLLTLGVLTSQWDAANPTAFQLAWLPALGLSFDLWLDGPALFYAWLVLGIGWLVFWYAGYYMDPTDSPWRFYGVMVFFMGAMLGVVVSSNVLLMFVFWELTSVSSFLLIGHWNEKATAREGALRALVTTAGGGLALLMGIAVLAWILWDANLPLVLTWEALWAQREVFVQHPLSAAALILLLLGAFTKSAQFPFQYWLPGAMEAPTPVSAYLHAATMVKAGIYLLGRLYPLFGNHELWLTLVGTVGVITMCLGGFMAILSKDLKQLLAHSTVSQLGLLTAYYGFGYGLLDDPKHLLPVDLLLVASHAFFKGALFMLVGVIDHGLHTRDYTRMGGLFKYMPTTAVLTIIGCLSMMGFPLTLGFVAKELFLHAGFHLHGTGPLQVVLPWLAVFASIFTVAYCLRMIISPFFGKLRDTHLHPHEGSVGMLFAPALLMALCLLGGLYVPLIEKPIGALVNSEFYATTSKFKFGFYKYIDLIFWVSMFLFFLAGPVVFKLNGVIEGMYKAAGSPAFFGGTYNLIFLQFVPWFAKFSHGSIQSPSLRRNLFVTLTTFTVLMLYPMYRLVGELPPVSYDHSEFEGLLMMAGIVLISVLAIAGVLISRQKLVRLVSLSIAGMMVAIFFLLFNAPDLVLTQVLVEIVSLMMFLLLLGNLPRRMIEPERSLKDFAPAVLAGVVGLFFAVITYAASQPNLRPEPILDGNRTHFAYYRDYTKYPPADDPEAHSGGGANMVNVILVDIRGIDTMGEITVLGIAALGAVALISLARRQKRTRTEGFHEQDLGTASTLELGNRRHATVELVSRESMFRYKIDESARLMLAQYAPPVTFLVLGLAAVLFFAGHNSPGGGFIAGLLTVVGLAPYFLYYPRDKEPFGGIDPIVLIPIGIFFAVGTGLASILFGKPFLTSTFQYFSVPLAGEIGLASAMAFDFGVYLVVVGTTLKLIRGFGRY
ncbi:MAG: hydrogen gas-evolving membrane-bound hydrogenase subunit E [Candidatus Sumerlaeia bacterium]|nr:hydrogen gas-evolving membrane-bound hydrogenase subunit E [Candidatus Sumerlaeia bacterium]